MRVRGHAIYDPRGTLLRVSLTGAEPNWYTSIPCTIIFKGKAMPASTSVKNFFPGKSNSGHMNVNSTPYKQASKAPSDSASADDVQANGQFGNPSGKTKASPLSSVNGVANGIGRGRTKP